uniref:RC199 n=1 Tax=Ruegeria sp. PR1b TaxID=185588 RepID=Q8KVZ1_9RHOB|nr:iron ABC transporter permease [Ruegeria sp. PR1b]AAN05272.1 RC199 [Ruegeria sp. PR1b]
MTGIRRILKHKPAMVFVFLPVAMVAALVLGVVDISWGDMLTALSSQEASPARTILWDIRLPRILTGVVAGAHFALAGAILQLVTRNPIADPTILGISQGATLAVCTFLFFAIYLGNNDQHAAVALPAHLMPLFGCLGGLAASAVIFSLAYSVKMSPVRLILCGVAVGAVLHSVAIGLIAGWGSARLEIVMRWLSGSLYGRGWNELGFLLLISAPLLPLIFATNRPLHMLAFRRDSAMSFGLPYSFWFTIMIALASLLAASAVGVVGPLLFVGLMAPHLARYLIAGRPNLLLPVSAGIGSLLVTLADLVGRLVGGAEEIPVGVVTALLGAPVLLFLLNKGRRLA